MKIESKIFYRELQDGDPDYLEGVKQFSNDGIETITIEYNAEDPITQTKEFKYFIAALKDLVRKTNVDEAYVKR